MFSSLRWKTSFLVIKEKLNFVLKYFIFVFVICFALFISMDFLYVVSCTFLLVVVFCLLLFWFLLFFQAVMSFNCQLFTKLYVCIRFLLGHHLSVNLIIIPLTCIFDTNFKLVPPIVFTKVFYEHCRKRRYNIKLLAVK